MSAEKPSLHDTLAFAYEMHQGVNDWTGDPYIMHPIIVMSMLPTDCDEDTRHLALLHDVVEDCKAKLALHFIVMPDAVDFFQRIWEALLNRGYSEYLVLGLQLLTRDCWKDMTYLEYVQNIVDSGHHGAMLVKYADNMHNTDPMRIVRLPPDFITRAMEMRSRYERSKNILQNGLQELSVPTPDKGTK